MYIHIDMEFAYEFHGLRKPNVHLQLSDLAFVLFTNGKGIDFIELDCWNHENGYIGALLFLCWRKYTNEIVRLFTKACSSKHS